MPHAQGGRLLVRGGGGGGVDRLEWDRGSATRCAAQATAAGLVAGLMGVGGGILLGPLMLHMGAHPLLFLHPPTHFSHMSHPTFPISHLLFLFFRCPSRSELCDDGDDDPPHFFFGCRRIPRCSAGTATHTPTTPSCMPQPSLHITATHTPSCRPHLQTTTPISHLTQVPLDYSLAFGLVSCAGAYVGKRCVTSLVREHRCASMIVLLLGGLIALSVISVGFAGALGVRRQWLSHAHPLAAFAIKPFCAD